MRVKETQKFLEFFHILFLSFLFYGTSRHILLFATYKFPFFMDPRHCIWPLDIIPSILDPRPSILDPRPSTLDPRPSTLDPRPSTLDPRPSILDPRPSTLKQRVKHPFGLTET